MNRLTSAWFELNGVRCDQKGLRLMAMPKRPVPSLQGEKIEVPGRDGFLWIGRNNARNAITIPVECRTMDGYSPDDVAAWLEGGGMLRFSDEPNWAYRAQVDNEFIRESVYLNFDQQKMTIPFSCQPRRYLYPAMADTVLYAAGNVVHPGYFPSLPRITVAGIGDITLMIGENQIDISGGSVIIDSELMDCFDADGVTLANTRVTMDDFPVLKPGETAVRWEGTVTSVTIAGRW